MEKILIIDNYDSFTYNLVHLVNELQQEVVVLRNDQFKVEDINVFQKIILSPGPGIPSESGLLMKVLETYAENKSIFGVCLGMQAIGEHFGGTLINLEKPLHGIATKNILTEPIDPLYKNCPKEFLVGRYHSWAVSNLGLPKCLKVISKDENDILMSIKHEKYRVSGVQFHPESVLTEHGRTILQNWLEMA